MLGGLYELSPSMNFKIKGLLIVPTSCYWVASGGLNLLLLLIKANNWAAYKQTHYLYDGGGNKEDTHTSADYEVL